MFDTRQNGWGASQDVRGIVLRVLRDVGGLVSQSRARESTICFSENYLTIRLVAKLFEHCAKFRAPIGKCARKNATQAVRKNVRGAFGAAHIFEF